MSKTYWTSDLHFNHSNICKYSDRPWEQEDNDERLIDIWNSTVSENDVVWHLGDLAFVKNNESGKQYVRNILDRLNGYKRLILGNHDPAKLYYELKEERKDILSVDKIKEIRIGTRQNSLKVVMCHYAMVHWNQHHRGSVNLHGHSHGSFTNRGRSFDVGLDGAKERIGDWRFWTEEDIFNKALSVEPYVPEIHKRGGSNE